MPSVKIKLKDTEQKDNDSRKKNNEDNAKALEEEFNRCLKIFQRMGNETKRLKKKSEFYSRNKKKPKKKKH